MTYKSKYRMVNLALPLLVMGAFGLVGMHATHHMFASALPTPTLELAMSKTQYKTGEPVMVTLANPSTEDAYVMNNCPNEPLSVSRESSSGWIAVHATAPISKCGGEPRDYKIPANSSVRVRYNDWQSLFLDPGTYRIHANIEPGQQGPTVQFTVTP